MYIAKKKYWVKFINSIILLSFFQLTLIGVIIPLKVVKANELSSNNLEKVLDSVAVIDAANPTKGAQELIAIISNNKDMLIDITFKDKIVDKASQIVKNVTSVDSSKFNVVEMDSIVLLEAKTEEMNSAIEDITKVVDGITAVMTENDLGWETRNLKKDIIISTANISSEKQVIISFPNKVIENAEKNIMRIVIEGRDVRLSVPAFALTGNELLYASDTAEKEGKKAYVWLVSKRLNDLTNMLPTGPITKDNNLKKFGGSMYQFEVWDVMRDGTEKIDEQNGIRVNQLGYEMLLEIKYADDKLKDAGNTDKLGIYRQGDKGQWEYVRTTANKLEKMLEGSTLNTGKYAIMEYNRSFEDVPESYWAKDYIEVLAARHITNGIDESHFGPYEPVTRGQFAALLVRSLGLQTGQFKGIYKDIPTNAWYAKDVEAAQEAGIIKGVSKDVFKPEAEISREEAAVMIFRAYEYIENVCTSCELKYIKTSFNDMDQVSSWAKDAVLINYSKRIIDGVTKDKFMPKANVQRGQLAKMLIEFLKVSEQM